jgi:hypothetical protein
MRCRVARQCLYFGPGVRVRRLRSGIRALAFSSGFVHRVGVLIRVMKPSPISRVCDATVSVAAFPPERPRAKLMNSWELCTIYSFPGPLSGSTVLEERSGL